MVNNPNLFLNTAVNFKSVPHLKVHLILNLTCVVTYHTPAPQKHKLLKIKQHPQ
jgi:hypothetical protein